MDEKDKKLRILIASMCPNFKYDKYIKKKNLDPISLRYEFNDHIADTMNIFPYSYKINNDPRYKYMKDRDLNIYDYSVFHYVRGRLYHPLDIPDKIPEYPHIGVTKMYAILYDNWYIDSLLIVTFNQIDNTFEYITVDKWCAEIYGPRDRLYYTWRYSSSKKVCIDYFYRFYPIVIKDFIEDSNIGAEKLIKYVKSHNNI